MANPAHGAAAEPADPATAESAPRKRRRRAPTTGASVDCFACQETQTACDRRRPYCTQCLERGKTCSGYKTQLTWGVGVASRGKLRGLSLPVASAKKSPEEGNNVMPTPVKAASAPRPKLTTQTPRKCEPAQSASTKSPPALTPRPPVFQFGASPQFHDSSTPSTQAPPQFTWTTTNTKPTPAPSRPPLPKKPPRRHSLEPLQMPPPSVTSMLGPMPMTASVYGGFHFGSLDSAIESPPTQYSTYPAPGSSDNAYPIPATYGRFHDGYRSGYSSSSWRSDTMSSGISPNPSSRDFSEEDLFTPDLAATGIINGSPPERQPRVSYTFPYLDFTLPEEVEELKEDVIVGQDYSDGGSRMSLTANSSLQGPLVGRTGNLRELIHYYDQVIAPVILAFDGPTNPYRTHIIRLASGSDALQHAIAALAASNLRMRRDHQPILMNEQKLLTESSDNRHDQSVRKSSIAHNYLCDKVDHPDEFALLGKHSQRELYHKSEAIKALNAELSQLRMNPYASDETVLATLLVLCLYHICDTGVAKFRTQFAGVKKLMTLRKRRAKSPDSNWLLLMFKWFDAITATVNDREGQFEEYMDGDELGEWALENLAGCDGRLFKIISKLGRLNMLSQGKPVGDGVSTPRAQPPRPSLYDFGTPAIYNGFTEMSFPPENPLDTHPQFTAEWFALHQALHDWQFDPATIPQSMQSMTQIPELDPDVIDLRHISESFRYSALLYLERIAHPSQPSSAPNFYMLVDEAIYHIKAVKSDVYLLWPLFITGNECVQEDHRNLIRQRCRSIQSDSGFYNNTSTLDLLEKTWQEKDRRSATGDAPGTSGPFEWRKNMNTGEEEYIVI